MSEEIEALRDDNNELKMLVLEMARRISALEDIVNMSKTTNISTDIIKRPVKNLSNIIVLSTEGDKCLCGLQSSEKDRQIPVIELNMFNLTAFIRKLRKALENDETTVTLDSYKQHPSYAKYTKGKWLQIT